MLNKTKAALQGRLSHFSDIAENNSTLIDQVNARRFAHIFSNYEKSNAATLARPDSSKASLIRWFYSASSAPSKVKGGVSIIGHTPQGVINSLISARNAIGDTGITVSGERHRAGGADLPTVSGLAQPQNEVTEEIRGLQVLAQKFPQIWGYILAPENSGDYSCKAFSQPVRRMSCSFFPQIESGPIQDFRRKTATIIMAAKIKIFLIAQSFDSVVRCFLWRRLISFLAAAIRKPAVLSSGFFTFSINSRSSNGSLTEICSDLLFLLPVAITESPYFWWCSVCLREISNQALTWCSPDNILVVFTLFELVSSNDEARKCANTNRASHHNVIEAYIMAEQQHTQTHPKFTWRFLAIDRADMAAKPCRLSVEAETEQDARRVLAPHFILSLAARIPVAEGMVISSLRVSPFLDTPRDHGEISMGVRHA